MTLINKFFAPGNEVSDIGLKEISMPRLGRFVALTGKNGAGKSRLINKLEWYVNARASQIDNILQIKSSTEQLSNVISTNPQSPHIQNWTQSLENSRLQLELILNRITTLEASRKFKAIRFVPKQLNLIDPRQNVIGQLVTRYSQAKTPGLNNYEQNCLFYIQHLQARWWNADHQRFSGTIEEKTNALADYTSFQVIISRLLGTDIDRNTDGEPTLFGKPIPDAGLSDGQKVILQLCTALHAQRGDLDNTVFLLDEPENHLHPSAVIDLLKSLYETAGQSQIWVATHSIPLLAYIASIEPMSLWYVENGSVSNAGRHPEMVLKSLLGDEDRIGHLNMFTGLPAQLAAVNYAAESLSQPQVIADGAGDPQISQIQQLTSSLRNDSALSVLDYGAGKGRLLEGLGAEYAAMNQSLPKLLDYFAFDHFPDDRETCQSIINTHYKDGTLRYFNTPEEYFSHKEDGSIAVVAMCNVMHEISPSEWLNLFSPQSLILRALKNDGYLLVVEDQRIPTGEKAHEFGFLVLDTSHLRTLFSVKEEDVTAGHFSFHDKRNNGRLKAHLIAKPLLSRITSATRKAAIEQLRETAKAHIERLRRETPSYNNGQLHGFWTQQFANACLFLDIA